MPKSSRNMGMSVRARLLSIAQERGQPFEGLLTRYVLERLLYRLSTTTHRERFILKGAMLMATWFTIPFRPTRDIDFLGYGDPAPTAMLDTFHDICNIKVDDGVIFESNALTVDRIREELDYGGLRLKTTATVGGARVRVVIDIGFGDAIEPVIIEMEVQGLLDWPPLRP